jgi:hypothetical protein
MTATTTPAFQPRAERISAERRASAKKRTYFLASLTFNSILLAVALQGRVLSLGLLDWLILGFAVFRLARLISFDTVMQTYRSPFVKIVPHDSGMNDDVQARTDVPAWREVVGELLACPICTGTWASGLLVSLWLFVPVYGRLLAGVLSVTGLMEILFAIFEQQQWAGELRRIECGAHKRNREA